MIRPIKDRILVEPIEETHEPFVKKGSLFIPVTLENAGWQKARVAAIGPGVHHRQIEENQIVMFRRGEGSTFEHDDRVYIALKPHQLALSEVEVDA